MIQPVLKDDAFLAAISQDRSDGRSAALADDSYLVSYSQQADFARGILGSGLAAKLDAYSSWNTNANTVGTALAEAIAAGAGRRMKSYDALAHRTLLAASGAAAEARTAHARHFAGREADVLALWDGPRQREAYTWFAAELANLRAAFRWAADQGHLDLAAALATYAAFLGVWVENYEPVAWAEGTGGFGALKPLVTTPPGELM